MFISIDYFLNPLDTEIFTSYSEKTDFLSRQLIKHKQTHFIKEKYPYSKKFGHLPPSFITGTCQKCNVIMSGFICEQCGITYAPEEILNKKYKADSVEERDIYSWFLPIDKSKVLNNLTSKKIAKYVSEIIQNALIHMNRTRLTVPTNWGVKMSDQQVYYNYGTFFPYCVLLAEICQRRENLSSNAFSHLSDIETVASFGLDNIVTFAINLLNYAIALEDYRGFSYYLPNKFMTLNGEKFSTSRNHAIWVHKIKDNISTDLIRLYLIKNNSDFSQKDFNIDEFITFYNETAYRLNKKFTETNSCRVEVLQHSLEKSILEKDHFLMPENYSGEKAFEEINRWLDIDLKKEEWLNAFSIVAYPVMPKLSLMLWASLGNIGIPLLSNYPTNLVLKDKIKCFEYINKNDIEVG